MKVAIVYDRVNKWGGAERVLLALHEIFPDATLYTSVYAKENAKWARVFPEIKTSFLNKIPFAKNHHDFFAPLMPFAFQRFNFDKYDLVISVTSEFAKNIFVKNGKHICYCLTPTRYLWSGYEEYFKNKYLKLIAKPMVNYLRTVDQKAAKKPDVMIAISTVVQKRIKKYYGRESKIIFPPVKLSSPAKFKNLRTSWPDLLNFTSVREVGYYLVVSRLVKYKKIDLVIEAFNELGLPLVIAGTGREDRKLKRQAKSNIHFTGFVNEKSLARYYSNAKALIFPQEEDFGITAVETQSYGVPVIAYKAGGALDIVSKNTGVFFGKQNKHDLINAIEKFQKIKFDKKVIKKNTKKFSKDN